MRVLVTPFKLLRQLRLPSFLYRAPMPITIRLHSIVLVWFLALIQICRFRKYTNIILEYSVRSDSKPQLKFVMLALLATSWYGQSISIKSTYAIMASVRISFAQFKTKGRQDQLVVLQARVVSSGQRLVFNLGNVSH